MSDEDLNYDLPQINQRVPLRDKVYEILKEKIIAGHFPSGHTLLSNQLAKQLGVSRTPIREALHRLQIEGFVVTSDNGVSKVTNISVSDIESAQEIRELLEVFACKQAAQKISKKEISELRELHQIEKENLSQSDEKVMSQLNTEIHSKIMEAAHNSVLFDTVNFLHNRIPSFSLFALGARENLKFFVEDHGSIIEAIGEGNEEAAAQKMSDHVRRAWKLLSRIYPNTKGD